MAHPLISSDSGRAICARAAVAVVLGVIAAGGPALAQPANDACAAAAAIAADTPAPGTLAGATADGGSPCNLDPVGDVYHVFTTGVAGTYTFTLCGGTAWDAVLSLHGGCPADDTTLIACDDDGCRPAGSEGFGFASSLSIDLPAGQSYLVRVSAYDATVAAGVYSLLIVAPAPPVGACCLAGVCTIQTAAVCQTVGGVYRGDYTSCVAPASAPTAYSSGVAVAIPDNAPSGVSITITVTDAFVVADVHVELTLSHTFAGDLTATISHAGRTATLMERLGGGSGGDDSNFAGLYGLSDVGYQTLWQAALAGAPDTTSTIVTGLPFRAVDRYANTVVLRHVFAGVASAGDWTLTISDNARFDTGTLGGWRLTLDRAGGDPCDTNSGACCAGASCSPTSAQACSGPNRRFVGPGTMCNPAGNSTSPCCRADFNQIGGVTVQDIFDYLSAYFTAQPTADLQGNGLSVQDLFDFLAVYFAGCA